MKVIAQPFYDGNVRYIVESILVVLFGLPVLLLGSVSTVFASLCLGQLSNKNKLLLSFAAFAGIGIVQSTVSGLVSTSAFVFNTALTAAADTMILVRIILSFLLMCACNWVSLWILNKKLNLE